MKCCICGTPVSEEQAKKNAVIVDGQRLATCGKDHHFEARQNPAECVVSADTSWLLTL